MYRNIYVPYFIKESGDTDDDAILKCCKQHWVYKKNKNIKAHNNKINKLKKPAQEPRKPVTVDLAPNNLNQPGELYPEAICYLMFKEHPMFIRDASTMSLDESPTASSDDTANSPSTATDDIEDATLRNKMTTKGYFKSRNIVRAEEKERKKKKVSNGVVNENIVDLTIDNHHRAAAATKHADAATLQAAASFHQSQLAALQKAQDLGIGNDVLRPFILKTLNDLYSSGGSVLKSLPNKTKPADDDTEIIFIETCRSVERKRPVDNNKALLCAAGDNCVEASNTVNKDDPVCPMCKKTAHASCIAADDVKEGCLMCFVDDEV